MRIVELDEIKQKINFAADLQELLDSQKSVFVDYSSALYEVPAPMQFAFPQYGSDCHIKGDYKIGSDNFVVKIANAGRFGNKGVIMIFATASSELKVILNDDGFLTTLRTALAGLIVSEIVPFPLKNIGIIGSGNLAKLLHDLLYIKYPNSNIMLFARDINKSRKITNDICRSAEELVSQRDMIVTAISSLQPVIRDINRENGKAIIALGSDNKCKSKLNLELFGKVDMVIVDSKTQSLKYGGVAKAIKTGIITEASLIENEEVLKTGAPSLIKTIIADFSDIGAQDAAKTEFILSRL